MGRFKPNTPKFQHMSRHVLLESDAICNYSAMVSIRKSAHPLSVDNRAELCVAAIRGAFPKPAASRAG
jgi:hypothetical protein